MMISNIILFLILLAFVVLVIDLLLFDGDGLEGLFRGFFGCGLFLILCVLVLSISLFLKSCGYDRHVNVSIGVRQ